VGIGVGASSPVLTDLGSGSIKLTTSGNGAAGDAAISNSTAGGFNTTQFNVASSTGGTGTQTVTVKQTAGDITVGGNIGVAADNLSLIATVGKIADGAGTVTGAAVVLDSVTGVGTGTSGRVNTAADTLAARSTTSGGVFVNESNAVTLDVLGAANRAAGAAAYDVTAGGTITVS